MDPKIKEEARKRVAEASRKQLADGTWPQVLAVHTYENPAGSVTSKEELARLKSLYEQAGYANIAAFVGLAMFDEVERGIPTSFSFTLRRRLVPGNEMPTDPAEIALSLACPDIVVGTRRGLIGAATWFGDVSKVMNGVPPESMQVMDKVFGEAIALMTGPSRALTVTDMVKIVASDDDAATGSAHTPVKH